jgi:protein-tyrosine-phosphatase
MSVPLFICHANCCRSVLARYLYEHLCPGFAALGAGVEAGDALNDKAELMLAHWGIDARSHVPRQLTRELCQQSEGLFLMTPQLLSRLLREYGDDLADKSYLFADPYTVPLSFRHGEYIVYDPSWDERGVAVLHREFAWMRERVVQIHETLQGRGSRFVPARDYLSLLELIET